MSSTKAINLLYILGNGHSGTTLLNCLISSSEQIFAGGHLRNLYKLYTEPETRLCGCGNVVQDCDWWNSVKSRMDNEGLVIPDKKGKYIPKTIYGFYKAILENGNESIICDSSLDYSYLKQLEKLDNINVFVIHIVRDGRAVWYSHNKKNSKANSVPFSWLMSNLYLRFKYRNANNYHLVRYEDIVSRPEQVVKNILSRVSVYFNTNIAIDLHGSTLVQSNHIFSGNRMRHDKKIEIRVDDKYITQINKLRWWALNAIMCIGLLFFKYSLRQKQPE